VGQQKIKIVRTNQQSNLRRSCQSIFSLSRHHPSPTHKAQQKIKILRANRQSNLCPNNLFVVPRQFAQDIGEWPENRILIPISIVLAPPSGQKIKILIPEWTYFHCPGTTLIRCEANLGGARTTNRLFGQWEIGPSNWRSISP